jgi:hypothetical protein
VPPRHPAFGYRCAQARGKSPHLSISVKVFKILALIAGTHCLVFCGAFGPQAHVLVFIPAPPSHWAQAFPDLEFLLVFPDAAGREQSVRAVDPGKPVRIDCSKEGNTAVLAYPCTSMDGEGEGHPGMLRPAGGLYPGSLDESRSEPTLLLDWKDGTVATVLSRLRSMGRDTSLLNAARLSRYFHEVEDPWKLDLDAIEEKLAEGSFSAYDIDPLSCRDIQIRAGAGEWFLESPFSPVTTAADDGILSILGVSLGMHRLFTVDGRLTNICVSASGTAVAPVR